MDPFLRLTVFLSRFTRRRWSRTEALVLLGVLGLALAVGLIEWLGYWPDALKADRVRRAPSRM